MDKEKMQDIKERLDLFPSNMNEPAQKAYCELFDYINNLEQQCNKQKEVIDKAINELFILKDMIYKPETREENFEIQRKISSLIKRLNGKEVSE